MSAEAAQPPARPLRHRPSHVAEYVLLRAIGGIVNALPYRAALLMGWILAWLAFRVGGRRVRDAKRRIRSVLGEDLPPSRQRQIAWLSMRNLFFNSVEMLRAPRLTLHWIRRHCDCDTALQSVREAMAGGRGAIAAVPHMGNWEMAGLICHLHGLPIFSIAATQKNPLADEYLNRLRSSTGAAVVARGSGTMRAVLQHLREGKLLAILPDVRVRLPGVPVAFLGGTANLGPGMALFARHADVPIIPGLARRIGWSRHELRALPPVQPDKSLDKDADVARMTARVMEIVEKAIREEPEQWFWYNRRWILDPL